MGILVALGLMDPPPKVDYDVRYKDPDTRDVWICATQVSAWYAKQLRAEILEDRGIRASIHQYVTIDGERKYVGLAFT